MADCREAIVSRALGVKVRQLTMIDCVSEYEIRALEGTCEVGTSGGTFVTKGSSLASLDMAGTIRTKDTNRVSLSLLVC